MFRIIPKDPKKRRGVILRFQHTGLWHQATFLQFSIIHNLRRKLQKVMKFPWRYKTKKMQIPQCYAVVLGHLQSSSSWTRCKQPCSQMVWEYNHLRKYRKVSMPSGIPSFITRTSLSILLSLKGRNIFIKPAMENLMLQ